MNPGYQKFLTSEFWRDFRISILANRRCRCHVCGFRSLSNDIHHIWYPPNIWLTKPEHVVVLCRECHGAIHDLFHPKIIKSFNEARAAYLYARAKLKMQLVDKWPAKQPLIKHCSCCQGNDELAHYNIVKFDKKFKISSNHFIYLCKVCGDLFWKYIDTASCQKARQVFAQYDKIKPLVKNRLTHLLP